MSREYTVLVTGFGANLNAPYGNNTSNPAGIIAGRMPPSLSADHPLNSTGHEIRILDSVAGGWDSIRGEMGFIRQRLQELHAEQGNSVDLWIHLGRSPWDFVTCERFAFRQDFTSSWLNEEAQKGYYLSRDNVGQSAHDLGPNPWTNVPMGLNAEFDVDAIVADASEALQKSHGNASGQTAAPLEIRSHFEAANLGCGYCFYESMANCFVAGRKRHVLFMHVPRYTDDENIDKAKDAILAAIGGSVADLKRQEQAPPQDFKQAFGNVR